MAKKSVFKKKNTQKPLTEAILHQEWMVYGVKQQISKHISFLVPKLVSG